jgi:NAD(P)-dependent dehydrogenase (short-subunit alcohol dehydrogenase family)
MDMEADLGIDSIKRVEILGAMQDLYPDLPKLSNDELAEMRTLGHIIEKMSGSSAPVPVVEVPVAIPENIPSVQISRGEVRLKYLPEPDYLEYNLSQNSVCLLTDDGTAGTAGVAQVLSQEGWRVVVLSFPQNLVAGRTELPEGIARVELPEASEVRLEQTLKEIAERFGPVSGFIHLNPRFESQNVVFLETEKTIVRQVFFVAKYLKKSLNEAARRGSAMFLTVTRLDGQLGLSGDTAYSAVGGGLFGLTKSLNLEWDNVYCRAVDLSPELNDEEAVRAIMAELHDPDRLISEVGYSNNGRFTLVSEEAVPSGKAL